MKVWNDYIMYSVLDDFFLLVHTVEPGYNEL